VNERTEVAHPHPSRLVRYPSGTASGLSGQRLVVGVVSALLMMNARTEGSYSRRHGGPLALLRDREPRFRAPEGTRR